jgi:hypothetical protein
MRSARRSRPRGLLRAWAGDALWRQFVAWLAGSALSLAIAAAVFAIIWFVLAPWMIDGFTDVIRRRDDTADQRRRPLVHLGPPGRWN